jgi:alkylation response protein AidB-like acyl-CoA dehydrogenase
LDFSLTDEQQMIQKLVRDFATDFVKSQLYGKEWIENPKDRFPWAVVDKGFELGLKALNIPKEYGGVEADTLTLCLADEELAAVDQGVAEIFDQTWNESRKIATLGTREQKDWFFPKFLKEPRFFATTTFTEPTHGTDHWIPYDGTHLDTTARLEGDEWVINGTKIFITMGAEASVFLCYACTDSSKPMSQGTSLIMVPSKSPGIRVGTIYDKIAERFVNNAEIIYDGCRVPRENLVGGLNQALQQSDPRLAETNVEAGSIALGTARGAYEEALNFAKQRVQGGRPIIEHQAIGMKLAEMASMLEAARSLVWKAAWAVQYMRPYDPRLPSMAKWFAADVGCKVCSSALEIFGGSGIMYRNNPIQKYVRDSLAMIHSDGTKEAHLLKIMRRL